MVNPQASVIEKHLSNTFGDRRGVNLAGMEFGETVSAAKPGMPGQDYFYEPETSFTFLASRGIKTIRLPFRWERIQPTLNGPLKESEVTHIRNMLDAAKQNGIKVILDLHNYGAYNTGQASSLLGGGKLTHDHLTDVWLKLSKEFKGHGAVLGYGIMNEPHDLPAGDSGSPAKNWEAASQKVVDGLRRDGDKTLVLIAGYDWSSLTRWRQNHPKAWIHDPAKNVRYEAHHYWDTDGSGFYESTFQQEIRDATQ
jgi:aryl-phospho-beta-D-glucosidase BglC (GH1 family)